MKHGRKKTARLSKELGPSSLAAAVAMDATVGDGLSVKDASSDYTVVISTPRGDVASRPLPFRAVAEIRELLESDIARIERLSVDTPIGTVLVPGDLLRQSLIRFLPVPARTRSS